MLWIDWRKELMPEELKYPGWQTDRDNDGYTPLMIWVDYCKKPIPEDMKYPGWQTDRGCHGHTPLMIWIYCHKGEPIPEDLKYPGWETDRDKMKWTSILGVMKETKSKFIFFDRRIMSKFNKLRKLIENR